jgi:hypothetical protein
MLLKFVAFFITAMTFACNGSSVCAQYGQVKTCPEHLRLGFDSINQADSRKILSTLAGAEFGGRGTGQVGYLKAAQFVAGKLVELGLEPVGANAQNSSASPPRDVNAFLHYVPLQQRSAIVEHCAITAVGKLSIPAKGNIGFDTYSQSTEIDGPLMFINCPRGKFQFPMCRRRH